MSSKTSKFCLLEFFEENERAVTIIPQIWLREEEKLFWWPAKGYPTKAWIVNCKVPDPATRKLCTFTKILESHDSYEKLERAEEKALDVSDVLVTETDEDSALPLLADKRKTRLPERYRRSPEMSLVSCSLESLARSRERSRSRSTNRISTRDDRRSRSTSRRPTRDDRRSRSTSRRPTRDDRRSRSTSRRPTRDDRRSRSTSRRPTRDDRRSRSGSRRPGRVERRNWGQLARCSQSPPPLQQPLRGPRDPDLSTKIVDFLTPFFTRLHKRQSEILDRISALDNRVARIEETIQKNGTTPVVPHQPPPPALPEREYPLHTPEDLLQLDKELGDDAVKSRAVLFLSTIGGTCLSTTTNSIWKWLLGPRLAFSHTLTGKVKTKGRLRDFRNLLDTVYKAVRQRFLTATLQELDGLTAHFLTRSCDRGGLKQEREAKKKERDAATPLCPSLP